MSQAGIISTSSGPVPPTVPTSFTTDNGTAVPAANILDVRGIDSTSVPVTVVNNNINGIEVIGGLANTGSANRVQVQLTNRIHGSLITTDASTQILVSFPLGSTPGAYLLTTQITAFNVTDTLGSSYQIQDGVRTNGIAGVFLSDAVSNEFEETGMEIVLISAQITNNVYEVIVQGIAGKTINWFAVLNFIFVS